MEITMNISGSNVGVFGVVAVRELEPSAISERWMYGHRLLLSLHPIRSSGERFENYACLSGKDPYVETQTTLVTSWKCRGEASADKRVRENKSRREHREAVEDNSIDWQQKRAL